MRFTPRSHYMLVIGVRDWDGSPNDMKFRMLFQRQKHEICGADILDEKIQNV